MRIAVLSPVWFPVPPSGYGGIESVVSLLADGLVDHGHDVTLFASGDSQTTARLASIYDVAPSEWIGHTFWELQHTVSCLVRDDEFDVISDHTGLLGLALGSMGPTPFAHTVHGPLTGEPGKLYAQITAMTPNNALIAVSDTQRLPMPDLPWVATCRNAIDLVRYPFKPERGDYLLFLGRMTADKGAHRAVEVARESGLPLKLAGKCREPLEQQYFEEHVHPHLSDRIEYVGEVTHDEKIELLQHARATLFPIEWAEPFGLVMIESMACGTPVMATRFGAVPEVVEDGVTGVIVDRAEEMAAALERADAIDPHVQRRAVEERFAPARMVADYLRAYELTIERWNAREMSVA
jgi:glycosyltransferase involved in cell wall biosynthesis